MVSPAIETLSWLCGAISSTLQVPDGFTAASPTRYSGQFSFDYGLIELTVSPDTIDFQVNVLQ
jgi:hypothetical protein